MDDTGNLVARLTPPGHGAIAAIGLCGAAAWDAVRAVFRPRSGTPLPESPVAGQFWLGLCGDDLADEVVLACKSGEMELWYEVQCHGGPAIVRMLVDVFAARGLKPCSWQEFLRGTDTDALRAEAACALAEAATVRTASILLDQMNGAFATKLREIIAAIECSTIEQAIAALRELNRWIPLGSHLTRSWRVVICGAANVGKSSLVNALAGFQRSVVAPTPGTTRDVVKTQIAVDGWLIELADTAGLRDESTGVEEQGIQLARAAAADADLRLWVLDGAAEPSWPSDHDTLYRFVINKIDLPPAWDWTRAENAVHVSAATGAGLAELCTALAGWLVPDVPPSGAAVPFTPRLCAAVETAWRFLQADQPAAARQTLASLVSQNG